MNNKSFRATEEARTLTTVTTYTTVAVAIKGSTPTRNSTLTATKREVVTSTTRRTITTMVATDGIEPLPSHST